MQNQSKSHISDVGKILKVISDNTRLSLLFYLMQEECTCVKCISAHFDMSSSRVSHQLKVLKDNNLVTSRKEGRKVYYTIVDHHVVSILSTMSEHVKGEGCEN